MKTCAYCGRENPSDAVNCSGCGLDEWEEVSSVETERPDTSDAFVPLTTCAKLADADLLVSKLAKAGIKAFIPDEQLTQTAYEYVQVQVPQADYARAKELVLEPNKSPESGDKQIIASIGTDHVHEIVDPLNEAGISTYIGTTIQEGGLEISDISVDAADYERSCDIVESMFERQRITRDKIAGRFCHQCGSLNYEIVPHDKLGQVYRCKDCGHEYTGRVP